MPREYTRVPVADRFWSKVGFDGPRRYGLTPCWEWTGARHVFGYGTIGGPQWGTPQLAHRIVYAFAHGPIPKGLVVRHKCDNPGCVNPWHLELGTQRDNARDAWRRGRGRFGRAIGEHNPHSTLTEADVRAIRAERAAGAFLVDLAERYGVSTQNISAIARRKAWAHVP